MSQSLRSRPLIPRGPIGVVVAIGVLVVCWTCNYGEVVVVEPAATGHGPLTLSFQVDGEDGAVARELGWSAGIPGAGITITAGGGDTAVGPPVATLQTDSMGRVSVSDLPDGDYFVAVRRLLTPAEAARLTPGEDVVGFLAQAVLSRGANTVFVPASRRHSLVISEWSFFGEPIPGVGGYDFGGYLELENNSDTTVYLDGLVIGLGVRIADDNVPGGCAAWAYLTNDPEGIWSQMFDSLPGTGHTYPLAPGAVALIATDAIDHSTITPEGLDLSHANFAFVGDADAVNPNVPNTASIGIRPYWFGHGLILNGGIATVVFVSLPVDTAALPKTEAGPSDGTYALGIERIPRAGILDAMTIFWPGLTAYGPLCPQLVNAAFDRRQAPLDISHVDGEGDAGRWSIQRKVAYTRPDGRKILQHTRTTDADFFLGLRTPFQLP